MKAKELLVLVESLINLAGGDARIFRNNGQDGKDDFTEVYAKLERIGDQRDEEIVLMIT